MPSKEDVGVGALGILYLVGLVGLVVVTTKLTLWLAADLSMLGTAALWVGCWLGLGAVIMTVGGIIVSVWQLVTWVWERKS